MAMTLHVYSTICFLSIAGHEGVAHIREAKGAVARAISLDMLEPGRGQSFQLRLQFLGDAPDRGESAGSGKPPVRVQKT